MPFEYLSAVKASITRLPDAPGYVPSTARTAPSLGPRALNSPVSTSQSGGPQKTDVSTTMFQFLDCALCASCNHTAAVLWELLRSRFEASFAASLPPPPRRPLARLGSGRHRQNPHQPSSHQPSSHQPGAVCRVAVRAVVSFASRSGRASTAPLSGFQAQGLDQQLSESWCFEAPGRLSTACVPVPVRPDPCERHEAQPAQLRQPTSAPQH